MQTLPHALYTPAQVRELDRRAIEHEGIPGRVLMARAGRSAWQALQQRWPQPGRLLVLCGGGNNGGDGYVIARRAAEGRLVG
jgi:NAD(P)H-hydrate epimerase